MSITRMSRPASARAGSITAAKAVSVIRALASPWPRIKPMVAAIALNYTSGTTGNPKGVVYHHRGAYLNALGNIQVWEIAPRW